MFVRLKHLNRLLSALAVAIMILGSGVVATSLVAPSPAFAKGDKGHGGERGGHSRAGERGHSDKSKADGHGRSGKSKAGGYGRSGKSKAGKYGRSGKSKAAHGHRKSKKSRFSGYQGHKQKKHYSSQRKSKKHYYKNKKSKKHYSLNRKGKKRFYSEKNYRATEYRGKKRYGRNTSLAEFGGQFRRDVKRMFRGEQKRRPTRVRKYARKSTTRINSSPRPRSRDYENRGNVASELKGLNAANANRKAFQNAAPNSQVGRIAAYQKAAGEFYDLRDNLKTSGAKLNALEAAYDGRSSKEIINDIASLDPNDPNYDQALRELTSELKPARRYEVARADLVEDIQETKAELPKAARDARSSFLSASSGRKISPEAMEELHFLLGLPKPVKPKLGKPVARSFDTTAANKTVLSGN